MVQPPQCFRILMLLLPAWSEMYGYKNVTVNQYQGAARNMAPCVRKSLHLRFPSLEDRGSKKRTSREDQEEELVCPMGWENLGITVAGYMRNDGECRGEGLTVGVRESGGLDSRVRDGGEGVRE